MADLYAMVEEYKEAIVIYEEAAKTNVDSSIARWSVKDHLFRGFLCYFISIGKSKEENVVDLLQKKIEDYFDIQPAFQQTREAKLMQSLVGDYKDGDGAAFTQHVKDFEQFVRSQQLEKTLLSRVEELMSPDLT